MSVNVDETIIKVINDWTRNNRGRLMVKNEQLSKHGIQGPQTLFSNWKHERGRRHVELGPD